jgi:X-X-X-Leu-X-X-Gly heptad repeat protein
MTEGFVTALVSSLRCERATDDLKCRRRINLTAKFQRLAAKSQRLAAKSQRLAAKSQRLAAKSQRLAATGQRLGGDETGKKQMSRGRLFLKRKPGLPLKGGSPGLTI